MHAFGPKFTRLGRSRKEKKLWVVNGSIFLQDFFFYQENSFLKDVDR